MIDVILDTLMDTIILMKTGKFGPFFGALLGGIPQCGFAATATNLYITRIISLGTLIAIYLSTSDEMLPIMLSENVEISFVIKVVLLKVLIGMLFGFIIDLVYQNKQKKDYSLCYE